MCPTRTVLASLLLLAIGGCGELQTGGLAVRGADHPEGGGGGARPKIVVAVGPVPCLEFGPVTMTMGAVLPLVIHNGGPEPVRVRLASSSFDFQPMQAELIVASGASHEAPVRFKPGQSGPSRGEVAVWLPDGRALAACVSGTGVDDRTSVSPLALAFPEVRAGERTCLPVSVSTAEVPAVLRRFEATGDGVFSAGALDVPVGGELPARSTARLEVCFAPDVPAREFRGQLRVEVGPASPTIPITGRSRRPVVEEGPCDLTAAPEEIAFGRIYTKYIPATRTLRLHNGEGSCRLSGFRFAEGSSEAFRLELDEPLAERVLAPGEDLDVPIVFARNTPSIVIDRADLVFLQSAGDGPGEPGYVAVSAVASALCMQFDPDPVDFGRIPLGYVPRRSLSLRNCGPNLVKIGGNDPTQPPFADWNGDIAVAEDGSPFSVHGVPPRLPFTLPGGETLYLDVFFDPPSPGIHEGTLEVWLKNATDPLEVQLRGEAVDEPCGELCGPVGPLCPAAQTTFVDAPVTLTAFPPSGEEGPFACAWTVVSAPEGSIAQPEGPSACRTRFRPDVKGEYVVELTMTAADGHTSTCQAQVRASRPGGLFAVELIWDLPDDVDLHLFHPDAGDPLDAATWFQLPLDCHYANAWPYWDTLARSDDPQLSGDDRFEQGPEWIHIDQPSTSHDYEIGAQWFRSRHAHASIDVTARIHCGDATQEITRTLTQVSEAAHLATVRWFPDNSCRVTERQGSVVVPP